MVPQQMVGSSVKANRCKPPGCCGGRGNLGSPAKVVNGVPLLKSTVFAMDDGDASANRCRNHRRRTIIGLGDPVMDILIHTDVQSIRNLGLESGGCLPVSSGETSGLVAALQCAADQAR